MTTSISSMLNTRLRLSGMASGIDTESMIQKLMKAESAKVDKVKQDRQLLEWKRDDYRAITNLLRSFKDEYFDILKPDTNMRSMSSLSALKTTYNGSDSSTVLSAVAGGSAATGTYTISNIVTAKIAKVEGTSIAGGIVGQSIPGFNISSASDNQKISVTFNGVTKEIALADNAGNFSSLQSDLQSKLDAAFGSGKITVGVNVDQLTFNTGSTNTLSFNYAYNGGYNTIFASSLTSGVTLSSENNKFRVTLDGTTRDIALNTGSYANTDAVLSEVQSKLDAVPEFTGKIRALSQNNRIVLKAIGTTGSSSGAISGADISAGATINASNKNLDVTIDGVTKTITLTEGTYTKDQLLSAIQSKLEGAFGAGKAMVSMDASSHLRFESISSTSTLSTAKVENTGLDALGLANVNKSNKIDLTANLYSIKDNFSTALNVTGTADDIVFTINGETFKFNSSSASLNTIISTVNSNSNAGVYMRYDQINDRITVESKQTGVTAKVAISDQTGNLMAALGLNGANASGTDASMQLDDGSGVQNIVRSSNDFALNGISFTLKQDSAGPITLSVSSDPTKVLELVKGFVNKYNEVIDKISGKISEKRPKSRGSYYLPLTDDQKEAMKDTDIVKWEEKAKTGLLRSDGILTGIASSMRRAMYDAVSGVSGGLYSIGITTGSWEQNGKLVIDENKLKNAIANSPDNVLNLFSKESSIQYSPNLSSTDRATRYKENGIANRLYDILQDSIRTTRDSRGRKGTLIEKAGLVGDLTEFKNLMNDEISSKDLLIDRLNEQLNTKEEMYYKKFAAMETALSNMNSQSSWLSSQLSGGQQQ